MAYAAEQIVIKGIPVEQLNELTLDCVPGEHGILKLNGFLPSEHGEETFFGFSENDSISVCTDGGKTIFSGILTRVLVSGEGGTVRIQAEAKSRSILMDQKKKSRSFQDTSMSYSQLFQMILADYPGSGIKLSIPDQPLGEIAVQYQETDWQFLKRMLSMLNAVLVCRPTTETICLYGGVPDLPWGGWSFEKTGYRKEMGEYSFWLMEGVSVSDNDFLVLQGETSYVPEIFEQIQAEEKNLVIRRIFCELERGLLHCRLELQKKEGILSKPRYPMHLIGVALGGKVLEISGTKIKIQLDIDNEGGADVYWFPFSTLSASPDGSGWYYMPEKQDNVRVYFPSKYTKDVIAVSAVSSYDGKTGGVPDRMGSPSTKYLSNPHGQEMKLAADGIYLSASGGAASVKIGNGGDVTLSARGTIQIEAENNIEISAEEAVSFEALESTALTCVKGGAIKMPADGKLYIQGTEVKVN